MQYTIKAGVLYKNESQRALARIKSALIGPQHTFTKKIGQTVYIVRYYFSEEAKETMQEKINWMLVTEASRQKI